MGVVDTVRDIAVLVQKADNIELNQKILRLQAELGDLLDENRRLKDRVGELEAIQKIKEDLIFEDNLYWRRAEDGRDGPYCTKCWDSNQDLIRLQALDPKGWFCPSCEKSPPGHHHPEFF